MSADEPNFFTPSGTPTEDNNNNNNSNNN